MTPNERNAQREEAKNNGGWCMPSEFYYSDHTEPGPATHPLPVPRRPWWHRVLVFLRLRRADRIIYITPMFDLSSIATRRGGVDFETHTLDPNNNWPPWPDPGEGNLDGTAKHE